jgi:hypothetical protein
LGAPNFLNYLLAVAEGVFVEEKVRFTTSSPARTVRKATDLYSEWNRFILRVSVADGLVLIVRDTTWGQ